MIWHLAFLSILVILVPSTAYAQYMAGGVSVEIKNPDSTVYIRGEMPELLFSVSYDLFDDFPVHQDVWARVVQTSTGEAVYVQPLILYSVPSGSEEIDHLVVPIYKIEHFRNPSSIGWYSLQILFVTGYDPGYGHEYSPAVHWLEKISDEQLRAWVPDSFEEYALWVLQDNHLVLGKVDFFASEEQPAGERQVLQIPPPPLDQLKGGTPISEIACREGKILLEKNQKPYCVSADTAEKLERWGWSIVEKVPLLEDGPSISIVTEKSDFKQGEEVRIKLVNTGTVPLSPRTTSYGLAIYDLSGTFIYPHWTGHAVVELEPHEEVELVWDQIGYYIGQVPEGIYKISAEMYSEQGTAQPSTLVTIS